MERVDVTEAMKRTPINLLEVGAQESGTLIRVKGCRLFAYIGHVWWPVAIPHAMVTLQCQKGFLLFAGSCDQLLRQVRDFAINGAGECRVTGALI